MKKESKQPGKYDDPKNKKALNCKLIQFYYRPACINISRK
jgi:hypothetical protein